MDYEKKYKEAKEKAKVLKECSTNTEVVRYMDELFPELAESEDERIRKALMQNLKERFGTKGNMGENLDMPKVLAWLEKQGEQKPIKEHNVCDFCEDRYGCVNHCPTKLIEEQKTAAWSEKDEAVLDALIRRLEGEDIHMSPHLAVKCLKSIKDRVQPKQESDEKNRLLGKLKEWLDEYVSDLADVDTTTLICSFTNYLDGKLPKSLRPQSHCKPSDEQIKVCKEVYADILSVKGFDLGTVNSELNRLEEQLKEQMEE